jgi:hypothetical protein
VISTLVSSIRRAMPVTSYLFSPVFLIVPLKPRHHGSIGTRSSPTIIRRMFVTMSTGL